MAGPVDKFSKDFANDLLSELEYRDDLELVGQSRTCSQGLQIAAWNIISQRPEVTKRLVAKYRSYTQWAVCWRDTMNDAEKAVKGLGQEGLAPEVAKGLEVDVYKPATRMAAAIACVLEHARGLVGKSKYPVPWGETTLTTRHNATLVLLPVRSTVCLVLASHAAVCLTTCSSFAGCQG